MQAWHLFHDRNGFGVELVDVPWWAVAVRGLTGVACGLTGHRFCQSRLVGWGLFAEDRAARSRLCFSVPPLVALALGADALWVLQVLLQELCDALGY